MWLLILFKFYHGHSISHQRQQLLLSTTPKQNDDTSVADKTARARDDERSNLPVVGQICAYNFIILSKVSHFPLNAFGFLFASEKEIRFVKNLFGCTHKLAVSVLRLVIFDKKICEARKDHVRRTEA